MIHISYVDVHDECVDGWSEESSSILPPIGSIINTQSDEYDWRVLGYRFEKFDFSKVVCYIENVEKVDRMRLPTKTVSYD